MRASTKTAKPGPRAAVAWLLLVVLLGACGDPPPAPEPESVRYDQEGRLIGKTVDASKSRPNLVVILIDTLRADAVALPGAQRPGLMPSVSKLAATGGGEDALIEVGRSLGRTAEGRSLVLQRVQAALAADGLGRTEELLKGALAEPIPHDDALILDEDSVSKTLPYMEIGERDAQIGHEATVSKIADEQIFYLTSPVTPLARGIRIETLNGKSKRVGHYTAIPAQ